MISRLAHYALVTVGVALFVVVMVYPAGALAITALGAGQGAALSTAFPSSLFLKSVALAAGGALLAVILSLPGAYAIGRLGRRPLDGLTVALLLAPVLFPKMVYAFGWERVWRSADVLRCLWVWASWSWPIPALVIGGGWSRWGRRLYEEALVSTSALRAFGHAVLPVLLRHISISFLLLLAFFVGDYSVPHASYLQVYATELLLYAQVAEPLDVIVASAPVVGLIAVGLGIAVLLWRRRHEAGDTDAALRAPLSLGPRMLPVALAVICVAAPVVALARAVPLWASLTETVATYGEELTESIAAALFSGLTAVFMGACLVSLGGMRMVALTGALLWAALPGALVGEAVVCAYLRFPVIYDHWPIVVIGYVARFGWVGILVAWLAYESAGSDQLQAARSDGAGPLTIAWRVALASNWVVLVCGVMIVAALSLSEVATTSLVRVPSVDPIALILIEKFHRFEDGILISLSLLLVAAALPGAILAGVAARRWR